MFLCNFKYISARGIKYVEKALFYILIIGSLIFFFSLKSNERDLSQIVDISDLLRLQIYFFANYKCYFQYLSIRYLLF
ncbi:hypothetical protein Wcon_01499 [Wolbachia endosymbiont of Cylisticus convexus]|nr:hypothetical protein Wcon_01499 [Wolbachia endosymbiont of Cylisticus convexus]